MAHTVTNIPKMRSDAPEREISLLCVGKKCDCSSFAQRVISYNV